jgi:hypothetical protein
MSSLNPATHGASSKPFTATSNGQNEGETWQRRKPVPRKGHTKSRRGCFNCKRRRIKCNEKHPRCNHCIKAGLQCEYFLNSVNLVQGSSSPHPREVPNLQSTPRVFVSDLQAHSQVQQILTPLVNVRHALVSSFLHHGISTLALQSRQHMGHRTELCTQSTWPFAKRSFGHIVTFKKRVSLTLAI